MTAPANPATRHRFSTGLLVMRSSLYSRGMAKPRKPTRTARPVTPADWQRWTTEIPASTLVRLKMRAAQERRPMHVVLFDAIAAYLATPVRA